MPTATDRDFLDMPVSDVRRITHSGRDPPRGPAPGARERPTPAYLHRGRRSQGTAEVDARPSDALALTLVVGRPSEPTGPSSKPPRPTRPWPKGLAAIDSQEAVGAQALLDGMTENAERQAPSEPASP
jgi:hypothetical protein